MNEELALHNAEQIYRSNLQKRERLLEKSEFLKKEIEELYSKKDEFFETFNALIKQKDGLYEQLNLHRRRRDELNAQVKDQRLRDNKNKKQNEDYESVKKDYDRLELELQTSYHPVPEENSIIEKLRVLRKTLDTLSPAEKLKLDDMDYDAIKKNADEEHKIVLASIESIKELNKKIDTTKLQIDGINELLNNRKDAYSKLNEKIKNISAEIKSMREKIIELKGDNNTDEYSLKEVTENLEEKYDDALEILKSKKKIEL